MRLIKNIELSEDLKELKIRPTNEKCIDLILQAIQNYSAEVVQGKTASIVRISFAQPVYYMEFKIAPHQVGDMLHIFAGGSDVSQVLFPHTTQQILDTLP
jgi:hypothetical protein